MDNEATRAAALMQQSMARSNQTIPMGNSQPQQMGSRQPPPPPSMRQPAPGPPPPGAPRAVTHLTGSGRQIPRASDPLNRYKNIRESAVGSAAEPAGDITIGVNQLVLGVLSVIAFAAIFVLPRQLKVFWVLVIGLNVLISLGMVLYKELMTMSKGGGENAKYAEWAWVLLFSLTMLYTGVMVGVLLFLAWSLYTIANSKTNIARNDAPIMADQGKRRRHAAAPEDPAYV